MKSGNLNFLEPSELFQACNRTALPLPIYIYRVPKKRIHISNGVALLERQPCSRHFLWLSCLSHGDASIHLINAIFWANVLQHIGTVILFKCVHIFWHHLYIIYIGGKYIILRHVINRTIITSMIPKRNARKLRAFKIASQFLFCFQSTAFLSDGPVIWFDRTACARCIVAKGTDKGRFKWRPIAIWLVAMELWTFTPSNPKPIFFHSDVTPNKGFLV